MERDHLVLLGTTAGSPAIIVEAIAGNVFDPAHMEWAKAMEKAWDHGMALLQPFVDEQKRYDAIVESLRSLGSKMDGTLTKLNYTQIETLVGQITPVRGWLLCVRIQDTILDIPLRPNVDDLHDVIMDVTRYVPAFRMWVVWPDGSVKEIAS